MIELYSNIDFIWLVHQVEGVFLNRLHGQVEREIVLPNIAVIVRLGSKHERPFALAAADALIRHLLRYVIVIVALNFLYSQRTCQFLVLYLLHGSHLIEAGDREKPILLRAYH